MMLTMLTMMIRRLIEAFRLVHVDGEGLWQRAELHETLKLLHIKRTDERDSELSRGIAQVSLCHSSDFVCSMASVPACMPLGRRMLGSLRRRWRFSAFEHS